MKKTLLITAIVALGLLAVLAFIALRGQWPQAEQPVRQGEALDVTALAEGRFVHSAAALARVVREPQNTWSNLAFVVAGAWIVSCGGARSGRLVGAMLIAVGIGSFLYHASASRTLRHLDVGAMYGLFFALVIFSTGLLRRAIYAWLEARMAWWAVGAALFAVGAAAGRNIVVAGFKPLDLTLATAVAAGALIGGLLWFALHHRDRRTGAAVTTAIGLFALAAMFQVGDRPGGWLCDPGAWIQGHALWHVFSAAAVLIAVRGVERERARASSVDTIASTAARDDVAQTVH